jgi:hypothetical protein
MKKIIRLTESDLTRLVRRVIKEQTQTTVTQTGENPGVKTTTTPPVSNPTKPIPTDKNPFSQEKLNKFKGNTVNIYRDPENKKFIRQIRIDYIGVPKFYDPVNNLGKIEIYYHFEAIPNDETGGAQYVDGGDDTLVLTYSCDKPNKLFSSNTKFFTGPDRFVYSNLFTNKLKKEFCTVGSGGASVPKATFASTGKPQPSNLA